MEAFGSCITSCLTVGGANPSEAAVRNRSLFSRPFHSICLSPEEERTIIFDEYYFLKKEKTRKHLGKWQAGPQEGRGGKNVVRQTLDGKGWRRGEGRGGGGLLSFFLLLQIND